MGSGGRKTGKVDIKTIEQWKRKNVCVCFLTRNYSLSEFNSVQSVMSDSATPWTAARQASLSIANSWSLLKLMSLVLVMPFNHLILCCPCLLLPLILSSIRAFFTESVLRIRWPKFWRFSVIISPYNEYSVLIPLGWTGWISLQSKGLSRVFSNIKLSKINRMDREKSGRNLST